MITQERQYYILRGTVERQKLDDDRDRIVSPLQRPRVHPGARGVGRHHRGHGTARVTIRIVVVEGPQFLVGGVDVTGNNVVPVEEIRRRIKLQDRRRLLARARCATA